MPKANPFDFENIFKDELFEKYLIPYANWLFGEPGKQMTAQITGSPWEAALAQMFCSEVLRIASSQYGQLTASMSYDKPEFSTKTRSLLLWLSNRALRPTDSSVEDLPSSDSPVAGELCWEAVTWDTATISKCMLNALVSVDLELDQASTNKLNSNVFSAVRWMCSKIEDWQNSGMYSFGFTDLAGVGLSLLSFIDHRGDLQRKDLGYEPDSQAKGQFERAASSVEYIVNHLLDRAYCPVDKGAAERENDSPRFVWWGDYFSTAEVMEFLSQYHDMVVEPLLAADQNDAKKSHELGRFFAIEDPANASTRIRSQITRSAHYLEASQAEGLWGGHIDTIKSLASYIRAAKLVALESNDPHETLSYTPKAHIVFSALRWICDYKQTFESTVGKFEARSFMHTMFLTSFCADSLLAAFRDWPEAEKKTALLYETVIWSAPTQISEDRSKLAKITLDFESFRRKSAKEIKEKDARIVGQEKTINENKSEREKILTATSGFLGLAVATLMFITWQHIEGHLSFPADYNPLKSAGSSLALGTAIALALYRLFTLFGRKK